MPAPELNERRQYAVLWAYLGDDVFGQPQVASPVEILVRWEFQNQEALNAHGEPLRIDAVAHVGLRIREQSELWPGTLEQWYGVGSAGDDSRVLEVKAYEEYPDLKGRVAYRLVKCRRKGDRPNT